jgi:DGQHR domain-containing protein
MTTNKKNLHEEEITLVSDIFEKAGIDSIPKVKIYKLGNNKKQFCDIDVLGIYKNIIIFVECFGRDSFGDKKKDFDSESKTIISNWDEMLVKTLEKGHGDFYKRHEDYLKNSDNRKIKKLIVCTQKEEVKVEERDNLKKDEFYIFTKDNTEYFKIISDCTYEHCKFEILDFLGVEPYDVMDEEGSTSTRYIAIGKKVKDDFYILNLTIPVESLLKYSHVLRYHRGDPELGFQRLLDEKKLKVMREYLLNEKRETYPNNIIVILNKSTIKSLEETNFQTENLALNENLKNEAKKLWAVTIPNSYKAFSIIDGQHRLFSFAQTKYSKYKRTKSQEEKKKLEEGDNKIEEMAKKSAMVVTALRSANSEESDMPAKLFYEINTTQTTISPEDVIDLTEKYWPENPVSDANKLLRKLNDNGVLKNKIRIKFWQENRLRRTSLISYAGLKDIFNIDKGKASKTFNIFSSLMKNQNKIKDYVDFCFVLINNFLLILKESMKHKLEKKGQQQFEAMCKDIYIKDYYLFSAVFIGAYIRLLRHFLSEKDNSFKIYNKINNEIIKNNLDENRDNAEIQNLFLEGVEIIVSSFDFTRKEFEDKGYASNRWAKIETDLFYKLRENGFPYFGDESLISEKHRKGQR